VSGWGYADANANSNPNPNCHGAALGHSYGDRDCDGDTYEYA
jgi:hypothetical protein